jgi:type II secretory pathway pseudopilin PulG
MIKRRRRAFSYVEVLFAIALALVSALVYSATMPMANKSRAKANHTNIATSLAQKQMEAIKSRGYASITAEALAKNEPDIGRPNLIDSSAPAGDGSFSFDTVDNEFFDAPPTVLPQGAGKIWVEQADLDLRRVRIEVSWVEGDKSRSVEIGTLVANL